MLGQGLITSPRELHSQQRRLIAPNFQHQHIVSYADTMVHYAETIARTWVDGAPIDVAEEMMRLTLGVIGQVLFEADLLTEAQELGAAITTAIRSSMAEFRAVVQMPRTWPTPNNRRFQQAIRRLDALIEQMIAKRRETSEERSDLVSLLLRSQDDDESTITSEQVRDELMTLFLAGHESTANALAWTWYLLAQHPDVYARMQAEVDQVLAGRAPTANDLPNLPYTLQVLKESLRLYPPAHVISREVVTPFTLDGFSIPPHTILVISSYVMHRQREYFADPDRFNPARWTPDQERQMPAYAYLPFGVGGRSCIGNHFAMLEAQLVLATLAQRVTFELVPGQQIVPQPLINLRPRDGIRMIVRRRCDAALS